MRMRPASSTLGGFTRGKMVDKETNDLFDGTFVGALCFHDFEEQRDVQRHYRNGGGGLTNQGLIDAHPSVTTAVGL